MITKILIGIGCIVIVLAIVIARQPPAFQVARSATIAAPPSAVFPQINDLHKWEAWSPWAKLDPAMHTTYEGAAAGTGAQYAWNGNKKVGSGRMKIIESKPNELVRIDLEFLKPFRARNLTEFNLKPDGSGTVVTWSMSGKQNFLSKAFGLFMNMDKVVGGDFEKGLAQIKSLAEAGK